MRWAPKTRPQSLGFKIAKRSGTAAPNKPKTHQNRGRLGAENATSESSKKKILAELWQGPHQGLGWPGLAWAELGLGPQNKAPEPRLQDSETQRHGGPKRAKNGRPKTPHLNPVTKSLWQSSRLGLGSVELSCAGLGWDWLGLRSALG